MPYAVRKGKLEYRTNTGNGPCNRSMVGKPERRILRTVVINGYEHKYHATKGWRVAKVGN
jgi:hypothetical protein